MRSERFKQLADRRAALEAGAAALDAARALVELVRLCQIRRHAGLLERLRSTRACRLQCAQISRTSRCAITQFSADTN